MPAFMRHCNLVAGSLRRTPLAVMPRRTLLATGKALQPTFATTTVAVEALWAGPDHAMEAEAFAYRSVDNQFRVTNAGALTGGIADSGGGPGTTVTVGERENPVHVNLRQG